MLATDISANGCTQYWVNNVASTGTFVKNISMTGWTTGNSGIPEGWAVENTPTFKLYLKNESQYQISGTIAGLGTPDTISIQAGETIGRTDTLPITITQAILVGNGLNSGKIVLSNGQETIDCLWDASNNAFTGNGSITLENNNNALTINYLQ